MQLKSNYVSAEQVSYLFSQAAKQKIITRIQQSELLKNVETGFFEVLDFKMVDLGQLSEATKKEINRLSSLTKVELDDLDGWWLYDPRLWLYEKSGKIEEEDLCFGTARELSDPKQWFPVHKQIKIGNVEKHTLFVKYPKEIEEVLKAGKSLYFIKQHITNKTKQSPHFTLEETQEFEKIISLVNQESETIFFYGVW